MIKNKNPYLIKYFVVQRPPDFNLLTKNFDHIGIVF